MFTPARALAIDENQRKRLRFLANSGKTPQKVALRGRIVLLASEGVPNNAIAARLGTSRPTVLLECGTLHPDDPCATLPLAMPRQPRLDPFRSSPGIFDPALRPGSSTGTLHSVIGRGLEPRAGFRDARDRGAFGAARTARAAAR